MAVLRSKWGSRSSGTRPWPQPRRQRLLFPVEVLEQGRQRLGQLLSKLRHVEFPAAGTGVPDIVVDGVNHTGTDAPSELGDCVVHAVDVGAVFPGAAAVAVRHPLDGCASEVQQQVDLSLADAVLKMDGWAVSEDGGRR